MKTPFIAVLTIFAAVLCATGCASAVYVNDVEFAAMSSSQQQALADALEEATYKLLPRPVDKKEGAEAAAAYEDISIELRGKKVALVVSMPNHNLKGGNTSSDERYIENTVKYFLIRHVEAEVVEPEKAEFIMLLNVHSFGVDADITYFPIQYFPLYSSVNVEATVEIQFFAYHKETNRPVFFKKPKVVKKYGRYSIFGFTF